MVSNLNALMNTHASTGSVEWIGVRPSRMKQVLFVKEVIAIKGVGLEGDHYNANDGARQVTLIQKEHLDAVASYLRAKDVDPALTRRNIVIKGFNLNSLKGKKFRIGNVILEYSGECHPCSRMEANLGVGGYNAMRGHGGITAKVIEGGQVGAGDSLTPI